MITVVACTRNRTANVAKWLRSVERQTCLNLLEVVLVDYASSDGLAEVLQKSPVRLSVVTVQEVPGLPGFPEAFLKNTGVRRASGDVVICTNVDVVYEPSFLWRIASRTAPGVLVQAVRKNAPSGVVVYPDSTTEPENAVTSMCNDFSPETGIPLVAGADCQAMTRQFWNMLRGYDEELYGWGGLDSDLTCRALLWGMTVEIVGHSQARYIHDYHKIDPAGQLEGAQRNHPIIMTKINCGTVCRNPKAWGGIEDGVKIPELEREAHV